VLQPCTAKMKCTQIVTHGGRGQTARTHGTPAAAVANTTTTRTRHSPIDAVHELEKEALVVLVSDVHEALQQCQSLARAEVEYALIFLGIRCSLTGRCTTCSPSAWASVCPGALTLKFFFIASGNILFSNSGFATDAARSGRSHHKPLLLPCHVSWPAAS
jgi:hypothetical protein